MKRILEIELKSDLCAGTGAHFASVIDTDTAIDEYGIPFIPSRRLKGCLREAANDICLDEETINAVFGERGKDVACALSVSDAKIENYSRYIAGRKKSPKSAAELTDLFCSVRAQTAIENDTAKENSLRFTRVVNKHSPVDGNNLVFCADVEIEDEYEKVLERICKALRNIGYQRNRGLGAVKCQLIDGNASSVLEDYSFEEGKQYILSYTVELLSDLMLPASDANHSLSYIPGTNVLGAFAGKFVKKYGEDGFNELFLSDKVKFGNLYIIDKNGFPTIPAPRFMGKYKAESDVWNFIKIKEKTKEHEEKKIFKPFKKGYIGTDYTNPDTKIVYHNALNSEDGGLYTQYCLCSGQFFSGKIYADGASLEKLYPLLREGDISFGRSKTAQYSRCKIINATIEEDKENTVLLKAGTTTAFICLSDIVITAEKGVYDISLEGLKNLLDIRGEITEETSISTVVISGYNAKWNMKKPQFPAIKAGSAVVFVPDEDYEIKELVFIGDKQNEGFGRVKLIVDAAEFGLSKKQSSASTDESSVDPSLQSKIDEQKKFDEVIGKAIEISEKIELNSSQIGRLVLMCKESKNHNNFKERVEIIKTESFKNTTLSVFENNDYSNDDWKFEKKFILTSLAVKKYSLKGE